MSEEDDRAQLAWEARMGRLAGAAALASAALAIASFIVSAAGVGGQEDALDRAVAIDEEPAAYVVSGVLQGLSVALIALALYYLYRATKARRPEIPTGALIFAVGGPLVAGLVTIVFQVERADAVGDYVAGGELTEDGAEDVLREGGSEALPAIGFMANLALALGIVLVSLSAMRAGLLSRFFGIFGVAVGALSAFPLLGAPVILQLFWLVGLGFLFLDRWPGGRGPAWATVEAIPWPTAADRVDADRRREGEEAEATGVAPEPSERPAPRPASRKRRRRR